MSGDSCETHGWWEVDGQDKCPNCEIVRLRAEIERLQFIEASWIALKSELKYTPGGDLWPRAELVVELENEIDELMGKLKRAEAMVTLIRAIRDDDDPDIVAFREWIYYDYAAARKGRREG